MGGENIYNELGFNGFLTNNDDIVATRPDYADLMRVGSDRVYFSGDHPAVLFLEVDAFDTHGLSRIADVQHKAWNYRKVILLFALCDTEIRIYNCYEKPSYACNAQAVAKELNAAQLLAYSLNSDDKDTLAILLEVFSRVGVDNGLLWTEQPEIRNKIDLQSRIDEYLVKCLFETARALEKDIQDKSIIHGLLMRSLFILFLEDKGAANEAGLYHKIKSGCNSYFDILDDKDSVYLLFDELQVHFNGNISPVLPKEREIVTDLHLKLIKRCFIDGNISGNETLFKDWRLFNFEIIPIELLSEIYENFLGELRRERGQFYTPHNLVELVLSEKLPIDKGSPQKKILDPACGSGIFLVESYKRLIKRWKRANQSTRISFEDLRSLLLDNIFGIEIDQTAIRVAAFGLYIALIDELDPKTLWIETHYQLPYLIFDPDDPMIGKQGHNLWRRDTIGEIEVELFPKVDLIIGNPPFGTKDLPESVRAYCAKYKFANEYVLPFLHKSTKLSNGGEIALIFNSKVLTNTQKPYRNFRKWLFKDNHVEKVYNLSIFRKVPKNFGGQLFNSAVGPVSIVYFSATIPDTVSDTIQYWAPKTYVKSSLVDGVLIDNSDIKYLPRVECQDPGSKIWKVALWGNFQGMRLLHRLGKNTLKDYFSQPNDWISGRGLNADSDHPDFIPESMIKTDHIERYYTDPISSTQANTKYYRKNNEELFHPPFILFKEGQHLTEIACSLFYSKSYCTTGAYIINNSQVSVDDKKFLVSFLNSDLVKYILFLTASSWGIERERVLLNELMNLPSPFHSEDKDVKEIVVKAFDEIVSLRQGIMQHEMEIKKYERIIFDQFTKLFRLTNKDIVLIEDTMTFNLGLFKDGHASKGLYRTNLAENKAYAEVLCDELNLFLQSSKTKTWISIFDVQITDPLNLVVLHFGNAVAEELIDVRSITELREQFHKLDKYIIQKKAHSIYVQKHIRYYNSNSVYLIKPNQKRFWSRTQAMEDASSLIADIINMTKK